MLKIELKLEFIDEAWSLMGSQIRGDSRHAVGMLIWDRVWAQGVGQVVRHVRGQADA